MWKSKGRRDVEWTHAFIREQKKRGRTLLLSETIFPITHSWDNRISPLNRINSLQRAEFLWPNHLLKSHLSILLHWGFSSQHMNFGGHIQTTVLCKLRSHVSLLDASSAAYMVIGRFVWGLQSVHWSNTSHGVRQYQKLQSLSALLLHLSFPHILCHCQRFCRNEAGTIPTICHKTQASLKKPEKPY